VKVVEKLISNDCKNWLLLENISTRKASQRGQRRVLSINDDRSTHHPGISLDYEWYSVGHARAAPRSSPVPVLCGELACAYLSLPEPIAGVIVDRSSREGNRVLSSSNFGSGAREAGDAEGGYTAVSCLKAAADALNTEAQ